MCSLTYIINCKNAITIFSNFSTINSSIDNFFNNYCISKNIMYGSSEILATGNSNFKSTVFNGHSFLELLSIYKFTNNNIKLIF